MDTQLRVRHVYSAVDARACKLHGSIWTIAEQVNELRNLQGTGHGRTMHMGVSEDLALLVISRSLFGG
ncbi:abortive infection family protein [Nesterenkonia populi]